MTIDIKYENYSVKDFLEDDLFLHWRRQKHWMSSGNKYYNNIRTRKPIFPTLSGPCIQ